MTDLSNNEAPPTIAEFLLARVAEDEAAAKACAEVYPSPWELSDRGWMATVRGDAPNFRVVTTLDQEHAPEGWVGERLEHIARHEPARVLAECEAKRAIIKQYTLMRPFGWPDGVHETLALNINALASVYSDHPDYRQEWAL